MRVNPATLSPVLYPFLGYILLGSPAGNGAAVNVAAGAAEDIELRVVVGSSGFVMDKLVVVGILVKARSLSVKMNEKSELTENGTEVVVVTTGVKEDELGPDSVLKTLLLLLPSPPGKEMLNEELDALTELLGPEGSLLIEPEGSLLIEPEGSLLMEPEGSLLMEPEGTLILGPEGSTDTDDDGGGVISLED